MPYFVFCPQIWQPLRIRSRLSFRQSHTKLNHVHTQRPKLLIVSKQVNAELTAIPVSSTILKFCHQECARRWIGYRRSADAAMVTGIQIEGLSSVIASVFQTSKKKLEQQAISDTRKTFVLLISDYESVQLKWVQRSVEDFEGGDVVTTWTSEYFEVAKASRVSPLLPGIATQTHGFCTIERMWREEMKSKG